MSTQSVKEQTARHPADARTVILRRIKQALLVPAPKPGAHDAPQVKNQLPVINSGDGSNQQWLPPVGKDWEQWMEQFRANAENLRADFRLCENSEAVQKQLLEIRDENKWRKIATHRSELADEAARVLSLPTLLTDAPYDKNELESCDVGISTCELLVAQTGSVLVTSRKQGGRALSVLPPHHLVLATRQQLVPDLSAAFEILEERYGENYPSLISFITGPSRTGDIERILVLGAHGPKKLTILCV